jgi:hypothetical protein
MRVGKLIVRCNFRGRSTASVEIVCLEKIGVDETWTIKQLFDAVDEELSRQEDYIGIQGIEVVQIV